MSDLDSQTTWDTNEVRRWIDHHEDLRSDTIFAARDTWTAEAFEDEVRELLLAFRRAYGWARDSDVDLGNVDYESLWNKYQEEE